MIQSDAIRILVKGLATHLILRSEGRENESGAIGTIIKVKRTDNGKEECFLFKYIYKTGEFGLFPIDTVDVKPNDIIHYHDNESDVATYAALHGDSIEENESL